MEKYTVIRDTREKKGWYFDAQGDCAGTITVKLATGDYTLRGYERALCIERKASVAELAQNICQDRFTQELERMAEYQYAFLLLEFDMSDLMVFPFNLGRRLAAKIRVSSRFILRRIIEIQLYYNVHVLFCGSFGQDVARSIFRRFLYK